MIAPDRLQALVYGVVLAAIVGWVLYVGKGVFVPIVMATLVVYVIVGVTRLLARVPVIGPSMPVQLRYVLAILGSVAALTLIAFIALDNLDRFATRAPTYQASLLATIQTLAVRFGMEDEPTWATIRQVFLEQVSLQRLIGSTVNIATSIIGVAIVVFLYVTFMLIEQPAFATKIDNLSDNPGSAALIRQIIDSTNARIGSYLAIKAVLGFLSALISFAIMRYFGLEFAAFWAMLIVLLNFVPYIGSFLSVFLPAVMAIVQFGDFGTVISLLAVLTVVQFGIGNFLDPYLLGNSLNLSPMAILVSLATWTALWGIPGAFLAVPITAIMTIVFSEFAGTRPVAVMLSRNGTLAGERRHARVNPD